MASSRQRFMARNVLAGAALLFLVLCAPARAEISAAGFETANKLFDAGKFTEAAAAYEKLAQPHEASAALYFNLGNAYFKSGQMGRAIAAYRQAEQVTPRDPDVRANLQFARNQVQGPTQAFSRWQRFLGTLTLNEWTVLASAAIWLCFLLLSLVQWRPALKPALRNYILAVGLGAGMSCACLASTASEHRSVRTAIVIARDAVVHNGPLDESPNAFTAHDGAELRVLDQKDDWLQVSAGPRIGWLHKAQVLMIAGGV